MTNTDKTRILFVDDDVQLLNLFEFMMESMSAKWDVAFAESGKQALALLAQKNFDVIVSDMCMPNMNGAQLLNEVMKCYPGIVRLILTAYTDEELVLKCVGATHQCLNKPFNLSKFEAALNHIIQFKARLRNDDIRLLVTKQGSLPSLPAIYFQILDVLQSPVCSAQQIGELVATDAGLTSKMLQLVNSAFFGFAHQVSSADEAVLLLGVGRIRSLALAIHLFSAFDINQQGNFSIEQIWHHCLRVGYVAAKIVELEAGDRTQVEQAFTAGLLHDIGKLILAHGLAVEYFELMAQAQHQQRPLLNEERQKLRATHADVGAYLLDLWGLPMPLVEACMLHHEPAKTRAMEFSSLTAVHAANVLVQDTEQAAQSQLDMEYLARLGLQQRVGAWREAVK